MRALPCVPCRSVGPRPVGGDPAPHLSAGSSRRQQTVGCAVYTSRRGSSIPDLVAVAKQYGWLILDGPDRPPNELTRELEDAGVEQKGEFLSFSTDGVARFRSLWRAEGRP